MSEQQIAPVRSAAVIRPTVITDGGGQQAVFSAPAPMQIVSGNPRPNMNVLVVRHEASSSQPGYVILPHGNMPQGAATIIRQPGMVGGQQIFVRAPASLGGQVHLAGGNSTNVPYVVQANVNNVNEQVNSAAASTDSAPKSHSAASAPPASRLPVSNSDAAPRAGGNELIVKCNQFFTTLLQLASQQSQATHEAVRNLAQNLIDGKINAQIFTARLQNQLNSTPQPNLVPFLEKTLPSFRDQLTAGTMKVEGIRAPLSAPAESSKPSAADVHNGVDSDIKFQHDKLSDTFSAVISDASSSDNVRTPSPAANRNRSSRPAPAVSRKSSVRPVSAASASSAASAKTTGASAASDRRSAPQDEEEADEEALDNLMDDKQTGGANSALTFSARSFRDEAALNVTSLRRRVVELASRNGLDGASDSAVQLLANATQQRIRRLLEQLTVVAEHRLELYARDQRFEPIPGGDAKNSFKALEDADRHEQLRYTKEQEQTLLRAAKSRTKTDDPDQAKLKQKAKELAQAQLEEKKQQAANLTALAAIGGARKQRKFDDSAGSATASATATSSADSPVIASNVPTRHSQASAASGSTAVQQPSIAGTATSGQSGATAPLTRLKRATMKDLLFVLEQSPDYAHSKLLYRLALK